MEDETIPQTKTSPLIAVSAFLGLGCAIVAATLGSIALKKISATTDDINTKIEKNAAVELDVKKISDRIDSLALQLENVKSTSDRKFANLIAQTQEAINNLNANINATRQEIEKNRTALSEVASRSSVVRQIKKDTPVEKAQENQASDKKIHKIKSGDTFGKLAKLYKVSVADIQKANPNANSSKLKIGQEIIIP